MPNISGSTQNQTVMNSVCRTFINLHIFTHPTQLEKIHLNRATFDDIKRDKEGGQAESYWWQGGKSCSKPQRAFTEKFGLWGKFKALTYANINICCDLSTGWMTLGKKIAFLGKKKVSLGQKGHHSMVCIACYTDLNLRICIHARKQRICPKNSKNRQGLARILWPFLHMPNGC